MKQFFFLTLTVAVLAASGQTLRKPIAAAHIGLGAYSMNHVDVFSFTSNQASLAQLKSIAAGIYGERRFMLDGLDNYTAAIGVPTHSGNFGLKTAYSGSGDYNETQVGLAYARKIGSKADIGVQFNYNGIGIAGYGKTSALSFEAATILHISEKLHTGFQVNNPVGGKFSKDPVEKLPSVYTAGFGYDASEKFFFGAELVKEEDQPVNVNAGLEYKIIPKLLVRGGVSSATSSVWIGIGFYFKSLRLDVTTAYHPQLGLSTGLLLIFSRKKNAE